MRQNLGQHLREHLSDECRALGAAFEQVVERGIDRARSYGLRSERDLAKFLNLVLVFGTDFDRESWAARILDRVDRGPTLRINQLYSDALARLSEPTPAGGDEPGASD